MTTLLALLFTLSAFALDYEIIDGEINSTRARAPVPYRAMIPKLAKNEKIPVVYFLHGRGGNRFQFRDVNGEKILGEKNLKFAVVAFTGTLQGHDTYWVNDMSDRKYPWRDVILKEMIPEIEKKHKIGGKKNLRMVAGISMGSHGAFQLGLTSGMFRCMAAHSLVDRSYKSMNEEFPGKFGTLEQYKRRDPLSLLKLYKHRYLLPVARYWVDIGGSDYSMFIERARLVEKELLRLGVKSQDHLDIGISDPAGKHDNPYWTKHMPEYLDWYASCFGL